MLLALALVSLSNSIGPQAAAAKRYQKQFIDHLVSHDVDRLRARELHSFLLESQTTEVVDSASS